MFTTILAYGFLFLGVIFILRYNDVDFTLYSKKITSVGFLYVIIYTLIVGLRYDVGVDYLSYKKIFEQFALVSPATPTDIQYIEPAFVLLYKILTILGLPFYSFFVVVAFTNIFFLWLFTRQYKILTLWIFFFYICSMTLFETFNIMRQMTAFFMFLCSLKYIASRSFYKYLLAICFISLFHVSILLMLPFYFIVNKELLINTRFASIIVICFFLFKTQISMFIWDVFFPFLSKLLIGVDASYYLLKTGDLFFDSGSNSLGIMHLIILFFALLIVNSMPKMRIFYREYSFNIDIFFNFFFFGVCIYFISDGSISLVRLNTYFFNFLFIMLAFLMYFLSKTKSKFKIGKVNCNLIYCILLLLFSTGIYVNSIVKGTKNSPYHLVYEQSY